MVLLELFSGIGGFSKGLQTAGYSFEKVYFSEIENMQPLTSNIIFLMRNISDQSRKSERQLSGDPTSSLSEVLARISAQWATEVDCRVRQAPLSGMLSKPCGDSDLTFLSGKTLKESSSQSIAQTFGALSKRLPTLAVIDSNGNCLIRHGYSPEQGEALPCRTCCRQMCRRCISSPCGGCRGLSVRERHGSSPYLRYDNPQLLQAAESGELSPVPEAGRGFG